MWVICWEGDLHADPLNHGTESFDDRTNAADFAKRIRNKGLDVRTYFAVEADPDIEGCVNCGDEVIFCEAYRLCWRCHQS